MPLCFPLFLFSFAQLCTLFTALCPAVIECVLSPYPRNYSPLSRAIQHTRRSAQIDVVQYPTALFWLGRKCIFVPGGCSINTEQDILLLFLPFSLYTVCREGRVRLWKTWMSIQRKLPIWTKLVFSLCVLSACVWWSGRSCLSQIEMNTRAKLKWNWKLNFSINGIKGPQA